MINSVKELWLAENYDEWISTFKEDFFRYLQLDSDFFFLRRFIDLIEHGLKPSASKIWYVEDWQQKETQLCSFLLTNGKAR